MSFLHVEKKQTQRDSEKSEKENEGKTGNNPVSVL